jgi:hypothetical protein
MPIFKTDYRKLTCYAVFHTDTFAYRAEKALKTEGIKAKLGPIPRTISSDCGVCIAFDPQDKELAIKIFTEKGIEYSGIYVTPYA